MLIVQIAIFIISLFTSLALLIYGVNIYYLLYLSKKKSVTSEEIKFEDSISPEAFPMVTIQLPVFNERYVVARVVESIIQIDYPKDKLEIQLLDDSTDDTLEISKELTEKYKKQGYDITLFHRVIRTGQKGGGLREALNHAKGEFVAIFDADFVPPTNFLKKTVPYFLNNAKLCLVQTRWGHLNEDNSFLTRAQALAINIHFLIDQNARCSDGLFFNFNGTAGIWRKEAIFDCGNWQDDTLTEDLDLSYRAHFRGWTMTYLDNVVVPSELPASMRAYQTQQFRWAKGSLQTAKKLIPTLFKTDFSMKIKLQGFLHLTYYAVHFLLLMNVFFSIPMMLFVPLLGLSKYLSGTLFFMVSLPFFLYPFYCYFAQSKLDISFKEKVKYIPALMLIGTGVVINNARAFLEAMFGIKTEFVRTPKHGAHAESSVWKKMDYKTPISRIVLLELFMLLWIVYGIYLCVHSALYFAIIFYIFYFCAIFCVSGITLLQSLPVRKHREK